jgi:hypothetical protein
VTGCPRLGTAVIARNSKVVVFRSADGRRVAACSLENGAHMRVGIGSSGETVPHLWVKGRFVLAAIRLPDGPDPMRSLQLFDPREGTSGYGAVDGRIDRVRMSAGGAAIFSQRRSTGRYTVTAVGTRGEWFLQRSRRRPSHLRTSGTVVRWTAVRAHAFDTHVDPVDVTVGSKDFAATSPIVLRFTGRTARGIYEIDTGPSDETADENCNGETLEPLGGAPLRRHSQARWTVVPWAA